MDILFRHVASRNMITFVFCKYYSLSSIILRYLTWPLQLPSDLEPLYLDWKKVNPPVKPISRHITVESASSNPSAQM